MFKTIADFLIWLSMKTPYWHLEGYMNRYWLVPFNKFTPSARIHHILRSDDARAFHDHPWSYISVILRGGYTEVTPVYDKSGLYKGEKRRWFSPGRILFRKYNSWHRLELDEGKDAWTLFISFSYRQKWGFLVSPESKQSYNTYLNIKEVK